MLHWREQLDHIYPATAELSDALNIIGLLLLNRFRNLSHEEIITMLNLDLMQSRAGREIYQMGEIQGKQIGWTEGKQIGLAEGERLMLKRLLEKRFGKLPRQVQKSLKNATLAELEQWSLALLTATSLDEIFRS